MHFTIARECESQEAEEVDESGNEAEEGDRVQNSYPIIMENLEMRWAFVKKVTPIQAIQMLLMVAVALTVMFVPPVANFFVSTTVGFGLYIVSTILPFIGMTPFTPPYILKLLHTKKKFLYTICDFF